MKHVLVGLAAMAWASAARAGSWEALSGGGDRITVNVFKKGLFSALAHDHHFEVTRWRAVADVPEGDPSSTRVDVVLAADSLRDRQERLSDEDRQKVDAQAAGSDVLDAAHHQWIEFRSQRLDAERGGTAERFRGTMHGTLTVRGASAPIDLAVEAEHGAKEWRVRGKARFKQSAFGIKPFSGFGGAVGVKDELEIELALTLRPATRERAAF